MAEWLSLQLQLAAAALGSGLLLGLLYSLYESMQQRKGRQHHRRLWRGDMVFSLLATLLLLFIWFAVTDGSFSLTVVLMLWGGFFIFRFLLAPRLTLIWRRRAKAAAPAAATAARSAAQHRNSHSKQPRAGHKAKAAQVPRSQRWAEKSVLRLLHGYDKQQCRRHERQRRREEKRQQAAAAENSGPPEDAD